MSDKKVAYLSAPGLTNLKREAEKKEEEEEGKEREDTWRDFCDTTSIHGLRYIGGNNPPPIGYRIIWGVIWIIMFVLCIWLCTNSIQQYLAYDVNTATTFQVVAQIDFPGITVCNENLYRRSKVGQSYEFMKTLAQLTILEEDFQSINTSAYENWEHCDWRGQPSPKTHDGKNLTAELEKGDQYWTERGFVQGMREITTDSYASIAKFWWNSTEQTVDGNFLNHALDHGICFTFNPGRTYIDAVTGENGQLLPQFGYGLNITNYAERKLINAGPHNGLRILLNTAQDDYCGIGRKWNGAGFKAIVHETNQQPWFLLQPALSFSPGFDINVVVKPTLFYRKTSDLGRCMDDIFLYMTPEMHGTYYKSQCYQQCFYEQVVKNCSCLPPAAYRNQNKGKGLFTINNIPMNLTNDHWCWGDKMICMSRVEEHYLQNNPDAACPLCKEPCYETKFDFEISSLLFPSDHLAELYAEELGTQVSMLNDNYLLVNFHFESMNMRVIDETQAFTLLDLFTYFGGILGLFLGMSVMSIAEVFHQMRISAQVYLKKRRQAKEMNSSLSTILSKQGNYAKPQNAI